MIDMQARLRALVVHCLNTPLGLHSSACFYADKLVTISGGKPQDVFLLAQAYFISKQYRRALMVLKWDDMHEQEPQFKYLAARCLAECKDWEECLGMLGDGNDMDSLGSALLFDSKAEAELGQVVSLHACMYLLRARAYEMLDNRARAIFWYRQALLKDAYCYEAFNALIEGHMLSAEEELDLVNKLKLRNEDRWMQLLLRAKCKKYNLHNQMEGILQELEAPCADLPGPPQPPNPHCRPTSTTAPVSMQPPPMPSTLHQQQPYHHQQQHHPEGHHHRLQLFSPECTMRPVGPVTPVSMTLDDATTPLEPTGRRPQRQQKQPMHSAAAAAAATAPAATPGLVGAARGVPHTHEAHSRLHAASSSHGPPAPSATTSAAGAAGDAEEGMLLGRVPATPLSDGWRGPSATMASTPECGMGEGAASGEGDGSARGGLGGRVPGVFNSQRGLGARGEPCITPQGDGSGGGSDMEADTPGIRPTPVRTRVGTTPPSLFAANSAAALSLPPQVEPQSQQQQQQQQPQQQQREQQPGAGYSGRGGGCGLSGNLDVIACRADWLYHRRAYEACVTLTGGILDREPYALQCLPIHLAACVALGRKAELFMRGHKLVEEYPDKAVAWFAVGCYYMCTKQYEQARRYFGKATGLEPNCAAAWIAFGHAFSAQDERDQAMTAYRTASRLFPGLHLAVLGMGIEYSHMGNLQLAERMLLAAHQLCPADPATCHELGVLNYRNGQYAAATSWLLAALRLIPAEHGQQEDPVLGGQAMQSSVEAITKAGNRLSSAWEPTVLALGHCLRKQWRWAEALQLYSLALALSPGQPGTFAALGYTQQLMGHLFEAIEAYHSALAIRPDDSFTVDMLNAALEEYSRVDL